MIIGGANDDNATATAAAAAAPPTIAFTFVDDDPEVEPWPQSQRQEQITTMTTLKDCFSNGSMGAATKTTTAAAAAAAASTSTTAVITCRPGTPPPRSLSLFNLTQKNNAISRRRLIRNNGVDDEVHPLMMMIANSKSQILPAPGQLQETEVLEVDLDQNTANHQSLAATATTTTTVGSVAGNQDDDNDGVNHNSSNSIHVHVHSQQLNNTSHNHNTDHNSINNHHKSYNDIPSKNNNNKKNNQKKDQKLNFKQRLAMENFLSAQSSTDINPIAKEEAWRELVRAMKQQTDDNSIVSSVANSHYRGHALRSNNNSHSRRQQGRRTSTTKKGNDILGLIRIGGGLKIGAGSSDVVSIASGLTTEQYDTTTVTTTAALQSSTTSTVNVAPNATDGSASHCATNVVETRNSLVVPNHEGNEELEPCMSSYQSQEGTKKKKGLLEVEASTAIWNLDPPTTPGKLVRTVTPPSTTFSGRSGMIFPNNILTMSEGLPMISPLSLDGIFVDDEEEEEEGEGEENEEYNDTNDEKQHGARNDGTVENDIRLKFPMIRVEDEGVTRTDDFATKDEEKDEDTDKRRDTTTKLKSSSLFFDIGESFADNTKRLWNKDSNKINNNNANVVLSLVDSMSEEGESTTRSGCSEERSMMRKQQQQQPPPLLLPSLRNDSSSSVGMFHLPASRSSHSGSTSCDGGFEKMSTWEREMQEQVGEAQRREEASSGSSRNKISKTGSLSIIAHSNEGEIVSFHEIVEHAMKITKPVPQQGMSLEHSDTHQQLSQSLSSNSPRRLILLPRKEPNSIENGHNTCERSTKRRSKRRGGDGGNNNISTAQSLEEQILNVLQQQPESFVFGDILDEELEVGGALDPSANVKSSRVKNGTVGSAASAQDILRELRSSTSLQNINSLNNSSNRASSKPPLGSISIGMRGLHLGPESIAPQKLNSCFSSEKRFEDNNGILSSPTPALALNPSPRDVHRPNRTRRCVSDSTPATAAMNAVVSATFPQSSMVACTRSGGEEPLKPESMGASGPSNVKSSESLSPLERYCKAIGTDTEHVSITNSRLRGRIFPHTSPTTSDVMGWSSKMQYIPRNNSTNPFDYNPRINPFDSPSRNHSSQKAREPFAEQSSPILMEISGDTNISQDASSTINKSGTSVAYCSDGGVMMHGNNRDDATKTTSPRCGSPPSVLLLKPSKLDTIRSRRSPPPDRRHRNLGGSRESISQLNFIAGGESVSAVSALVRSQEISPFATQNVNDDRFEGEEENYVEEVNAVSTEASRAMDVLESNKSIPHYQWREELANATVMDDDVVEDAVRAATECFSTASISSNSVSSINEAEQAKQLAEGEEDEEDEFSVISTPHRQVNWSAFDDRKDGSFDDFDRCDSDNTDEWGDANRWGFDDEDQFEPENKGSNVYFSSPTSVAAGNFS